METILEIIESEDVIALVFLICLLCAIGRKMIEGHPRLRQLSIRFSFLAMIVYCAYTGYLWEAADPVLWSSIVLRGLVAAGLMLGTCWIFLGVLGFLLRIFDGLSAQATARQMERRRKRQQRMDEIEREQRKREYELAAPERERQAQIEAARRRQEEQAKVAEQLDRDGIRYACQLNYSIHAPIIEHRFPQEAVDRFINEYMNDELPVSVVRQRAAQLNQTVKRHVEAVDPLQKITNLESLVAWYSSEKSRIESLDLPRPYKDNYLVILNTRYGEFAEQLVEKASP